MTVDAYLRPPWPARKIGGRMARLFRPSVVSLLSVPGRHTGRWHSTPVAVLEHDGRRYLMSAFGNTEWSRNLRRAGTARLTQRGQVESIVATEVPVQDRPPLIKAYLGEFGRLPTVGRTFAKLPDPAEHPTFEIERRTEPVGR